MPHYGPPPELRLCELAPGPPFPLSLPLTPVHSVHSFSSILTSPHQPDYRSHISASAGTSSLSKPQFHPQIHISAFTFHPSRSELAQHPHASSPIPSGHPSRVHQLEPAHFRSPRIASLQPLPISTAHRLDSPIQLRPSQLEPAPASLGLSASLSSLSSA